MLYNADFNSCKYIFFYIYIFTLSVQYKAILKILEKIDGFTKVLPCLLVPLQLEKQTTHNTKIAEMYFIFSLAIPMFSCIAIKTAGHSFYTYLCLCLFVLLYYMYLCYYLCVLCVLFVLSCLSVCNINRDSDC